MEKESQLNLSTKVTKNKSIFLLETINFFTNTKLNMTKTIKNRLSILQFMFPSITK